VQPGFVEAADGVPIAAWQLGGTGPPLLVAHATGFHTGCYRALAAGLVDRFRVVGIDCRGHGRSGTPPLAAGDDRRVLAMGWDRFADDVLAVVDALDLRGGFAFGHSCGGATLLLAEQRRPGTFARIFTYEPVVAPPAFWAAWPAAGPDPGRAALRRRAVFASRAAAIRHYGAKLPLSCLRSDVLADYVEDGFADQADGTVRLRCDPAAEAATFAMAPHNQAWDHLPLVTCPTTFACGAAPSDFGAGAAAALAARAPQGRSEEHPALGHLGPFEDPDAVALAVRRSLSGPSRNASGSGSRGKGLPPRS